jgi:hypothetical protein
MLTGLAMSEDCEKAGTEAGLLAVRSFGKNESQ